MGQDDAGATAERVARLEAFKESLSRYSVLPDAELRTALIKERGWVERQVIEAGCLPVVTVEPPPAVGGYARNLNAFDCMFDAPYRIEGRMRQYVLDSIDATVGKLEAGDIPIHDPAEAKTQSFSRPGFVFIAMPMDPGLVDVADAVKEAASKHGLTAERIDDQESNETITERILESIRSAQFVVADLTDARPNVYYEAGYSHGLGKTPIYIAKAGTELHFDVADYPIIFFATMRELKDRVSVRLQQLVSED